MDNEWSCEKHNCMGNQGTGCLKCKEENSIKDQVCSWNDKVSRRKEIEILVKLPADYFMSKTELDFLATFTGTFRDSFQESLKKKAVDKAINEIEIPKVVITPEEIKNRMLQILAEKALEGNTNE